MYDEDDEYSDDGLTGSGRRRRIMNIGRRVGKSKVLKTIRRRMSSVPSMNRSGDGDEEDDDVDYDSEYGSRGGDQGFLKRHLQKRKEQQEAAAAEAGGSGGGAKKKTLKRGSVANLIATAGGLRKSSRSKDEDDEDEEGDDVATPLPGRGQRGRIGRTFSKEGSVSSKASRGTTSTSSTAKRSSTNKKKGFLKIKNAMVDDDDNNNNNNDNNTTASSKGSNKKAKKSKSGGSTTSSSKKGKGKKKSGSTNRRNGGGDNNDDADNRSVDSPPSVASTENNSVDGMSRGGLSQHAELRMQARRRGGKNSGKNRPGLPGKFIRPPRDPNDMTGASMEALSFDYYYQSFPWIIKTWIYFLTVVVPFTLLYYCFVGIFHSSSFSQNALLLRKVAFANIAFNGLGCVSRADFEFKQMLDAKGVLAKRPPQKNNNSSSFQRRNTNNDGKQQRELSPPPDSNGRGRLPRRNRSFRGVTFNTPKVNLPRMDTMTKLNFVRKKTYPQGALKVPTSPTSAAAAAGAGAVALGKNTINAVTSVSRLMNNNSDRWSPSTRGAAQKNNDDNGTNTNAKTGSNQNPNAYGGISMDMSEQSNATQQTSNIMNSPSSPTQQQEESNNNNNIRRPFVGSGNSSFGSNNIRRRFSGPNVNGTPNNIRNKRNSWGGGIFPGLPGSGAGSAAPPITTSNSGGSGTTGSGTMDRMGSSSSHNNNNNNTLTSAPSIWDVESMIPTRKPSGRKTNRPSIDKHQSILEIYEMHAKDERVGMLQ